MMTDVRGKRVFLSSAPLGTRPRPYLPASSARIASASASRRAPSSLEGTGGRPSHPERG